MSRLFIELHILQTVPPSNPNRDDSGSPKTAKYGGYGRARISSQAWKRSAREAFNSYLDRSELGVRTRRVVRLLAEEIGTRRPELADRANELATKTIEAVGIPLAESEKNAPQDAARDAKYLVFLSRRQIENLAEAAIAAAEADDLENALRAAKVKDLANQDHSVDLALFGRMVADQADLKADGAAQVAHALSVHTIEPEFDYFTAVDDLNTTETGAGMIDFAEFTSATFYRYANVNINQLARNLGSTTATRRAIEAFIQTFVRSMPSGKQNSYGNRTLPEAVVVLARDSQPINLVGAFLNPIRESESVGLIKRAAEALHERALEIERAYGERPLAGWVTRIDAETAILDELGTNLPLDQLVGEVGALVADRLSEEPR